MTIESKSPDLEIDRLSSELAALVRGNESNPSALDEIADGLERRYAGQRVPEAVLMMIAIARGGMMGGNDGWFGPSESRYDWSWLADRHGMRCDGTIGPERFAGKPEWFARLDRDRNGSISAEDLDWSDGNSWLQNSYVVNRLLRRLNLNGNGRLTRQEWTLFFDTVSAGRDEAKFEELREAWLAGMSSGFYPGDAPTQEQLVRGLLSGELGSLHEGPPLNAPAPDFTLQTHDGNRTIHLAQIVGSKPIVLMFGNFTCSPFRSMYPGVEDVFRRFRDETIFLGIYVREAHPSNGWKMESNTRVGVMVTQPTTYDERAAVAGQCHRLLNPIIPLLVDDIRDTVGNLYSGMPARLYVIDTAGRVAYKGGRGPFGFKVGEMEQALLMTSLDESSTKSAAESNLSGLPARCHSGSLPDAVC